MDYSTLTNAYKAMAPESEKWAVRISVADPFHFADLEKVTVIQSDGSRDCLVIFPLERQVPQSQQKGPRIIGADGLD
jgi:hypothetical protein